MEVGASRWRVVIGPIDGGFTALNGVGCPQNVAQNSTEIPLKLRPFQDRVFREMRYIVLLFGAMLVGLRLLPARKSVPKTPKERFIRWFIEPVERLKEVDGGGGAFVAMSVGFFLCERYFRSKEGLIDDHSPAGNAKFKDAAASHFDVNRKFFADFWNIYRNGMQHQGSPKSAVLGNISYKWRIDGDFPSLPSRWDNAGHTYICINPWGFTELMIRLFLNDEPRIAEISSHELGEIFDPPVAITPTTPKSLDPYP